MKAEKIKTLFLDIGGVLLSNGWGEDFRQRAMKHFDLDPDEIEPRHKICFDTYELGKMGLDEYLGHVIFNKPRKFSKEEFITFMMGQSEALTGSVVYFTELKKHYHLKVIAVSNEAREINEYRIKKFELNNLFDAYVSSCYVGMRKPHTGMYTMACDISQTLPEQAIYVDDQILFIEVARSLGIPSLHYQSLPQARDYFDGLGLTLK